MIPGAERADLAALPAIHHEELHEERPMGGPQKPVESAGAAVALLNDPAFQAANDHVHIMHARGTFTQSDLLRFFDTWGVAPARNEGLYRPAFRHNAGVVLGGRWALMLVLPWTTEVDVRREVASIHKTIGRRHRDSLERAHRDDIAAWLKRSGFAHADIARVVYKRRDAKRPSRKQIDQTARLGAVDRRVARYMAEGTPHKLAERRAYVAVRGTEGRGALAARIAGGRAEQEHRQLKAEIRNPLRANALTAALTELLYARFVAGEAKRVDEALNTIRAVLLGQPMS